MGRKRRTTTVINGWREFDPDHCCAHVWQPVEGKPHFEICGKCKSTCNRDEHGKIVHYEASAAILDPAVKVYA